MKQHLLVTLLLSLLALAVPARAQTRQAQPDQAVAASAPAGERELPRGTTLGSRAEDRRYAAREAASPDAKTYRGGDVVVISATAVAIILLVIVIIILI